MLILFLPWRDEAELLLGCKTYFDAYTLAIQKNLFDSKAIVNFEARRTKTEQAALRAKQIIEQSDEFIEENNNIPVSEQSNHSNAADNLGILDLFVEKVNQEHLDKNIHNLNKIQKSVFDRVVNEIEHQHQHDNNNCICDNKLEPLRIFCSGVGGKI